MVSIDGFSQKYTLTIGSVKENEQAILAAISYQKNHTDSLSVMSELTKLSNVLKLKGYFTNSIQRITKKNKTLTCFFSLGDQIKKAKIKIESPNLNQVDFKKHVLINNYLIISTQEIRPFLSNISNQLENQGKSFSKVQLKNITVKNDTLYADLHIQLSKKRRIDRVIVKGYPNFPKSFVKNYFKINSKTVFTNQKIEDISNATQNLQFVQEIKVPEVLFTKDSTLLYIYVKKKQNNSFDGIVNFASKEDGGLLFNGNLDLTLHNILDTGEEFALHWNSIGNERQEFTLKTALPFVFKTAISPQASLLIYKQDSTFINTKFDAKLFYEISPKLKVGLGFNSETSEELNNSNALSNVSSFQSNFVEGELQYIIPKKDFFYNKRFFFNLNLSIGNRKATNSVTKQFKIHSIASYIWDLSKKSSFFLKNETGFFNSDNYLTNELFRIGGARTIRGFNEQSIFAESYTFFSLEYRLLTSPKSYLYTITDIAQIKDTLNNKLFGLGLGYLFYSNQSKININLSVGKTSTSSFDFQNTKLIIGWVTYF